MHIRTADTDGSIRYNGCRGPDAPSGMRTAEAPSYGRPEHDVRISPSPPDAAVALLRRFRPPGRGATGTTTRVGSAFPFRAGRAGRVSERALRRRGPGGGVSHRPRPLLRSGLAPGIAHIDP